MENAPQPNYHITKECEGCVGNRLGARFKKIYQMVMGGSQLYSS